VKAVLWLAAGHKKAVAAMKSIRMRAVYVNCIFISIKAGD
jgi:hypothetical protein